MEPKCLYTVFAILPSTFLTSPCYHWDSMAFPHGSRPISWSAITPGSTRPPSHTDIEKLPDAKRQPSEDLSPGSDTERGVQRPNQAATPTPLDASTPRERPTALGWDGPEDPLNPQNWSPAWK